MKDEHSGKGMPCSQTESESESFIEKLMETAEKESKKTYDAYAEGA